MYYRNKPDRLLVFDIETVPDTEVTANLLGQEFTTEAEARNALEDYHLQITDGKNSFLRQPFHKIVALSYMWLEIQYNDDKESYFFKSLHSGCKEDQEVCEKSILQGFINCINKHDVRLVSYNGRTFDLPVIKYRAMKHALICPKLYNKEYNYRYTHEYHYDVLELLSDYGASARVKLNEVCSILGLPGKIGVDGSQVSSMYDAGELEALRNYCETDVLNTYLVYLRDTLQRGRIDINSYNQAVNDILSKLDEEKAPVHLIEFRTEWEKACKGNFLLRKVSV